MTDVPNAWSTLLERLLAEGKSERDLGVLFNHLANAQANDLNRRGSVVSTQKGDWRWMPAWCALGRNQVAESWWFERALEALVAKGACPSTDFVRYGLDGDGNALLEGPSVQIPLLVGLLESNASPKALLPLLAHQRWLEADHPEREQAAVRLVFSAMGGLRFDKPSAQELAPFLGAVVKAAPAILGSPWAEKIWERGLLQGEEGHGHGILRQLLQEGLDGQVFLERSGQCAPAWLWGVLDKTFVWWTLRHVPTVNWDPNRALPGGQIAGDWLAQRADPENLSYVIASLHERGFDWFASRPSKPLAWLASCETQARQALGGDAFEALMAEGRARQLDQGLALANPSDEAVKSRL